ncbi:hypothetical protein CEXT_530631 [Caerostris extrusa]|uniref:Uncharacterized protein n=1 Tax=Caerostris extrusa TaxID=172846 RepID=A0AAV4PE81_CAEEX|nr:hypothetical protein CEXT_530631 [Caerostris extrusa]
MGNSDDDGGRELIPSRQIQRFSVNVLSVQSVSQQFMTIVIKCVEVYHVVKKPTGSHYKPKPYNPPNSYPKRPYAISSWYNISLAWWTCIIEGGL